jgi:hypothetical protein
LAASGLSNGVACFAVGGPIAGSFPCLKAARVRSDARSHGGHIRRQRKRLRWQHGCASLASATISRISLTDTRLDLINRLVAKPEPINRSVFGVVAATAAADFSVASAVIEREENARRIS